MYMFQPTPVKLLFIFTMTKMPEQQQFSEYEIKPRIVVSAWCPTKRKWTDGGTDRWSVPPLTFVARQRLR